MKYHNVTPARIGRKTHLAQALALALALGGGVATTATASPGSMGQTQHMSAAEQQAQQTEAAYQVQYAADAVAASAQPMAVTTYVANCNDSGGGSLRDAVANAASGDTIDMTAMSCNVINLNTNIRVEQDDLTLKGKWKRIGFSYVYPDTYIHNTGSGRAFYHAGNGTLTFQFMDVSDVHIFQSEGWGACIYSTGNVELVSTHVHDCTSTRTTADASGGGIYAVGNVTLRGSSDSAFSISYSKVYDNVVSSTDGDVYGAGIYARGKVRLENRASVTNNLAESTNGNAFGGGIYAQGDVRLNNRSSRVNDNTAETPAALTQIKGAGIYTKKSARIYGDVVGNQAKTPNFGVYIGEGVGIFAETSVDLSGANISKNIGDSSSGGGFFTNGDAYVYDSTIADNYGTGTGAMFAKKDVFIRRSTISGNRSKNSANMKLGPDADRDIVIESSTISNNTITNSSTNGAAIHLMHDATIENSTITGNVEKNTTDTKYGAGIALASNVNVELLSTIVGNNGLKSSDGSSKYFGDIGMAKDATGATITGNHNLITASFVTPLPQDTITAASPNLSPLAGNGGLTKTHEPCRNSEVINKGSANGHPYDQRGSGFPRLVGFRVDIGAVEAPSYINDILFRNGFENIDCGS